MTFYIPKRWHYALPFFTWFWWNKKVFICQVKFSDSCRYDLQSDDQLDTNKLFGVGYFPGFHHVDSARFGWRYVKETDRIELLAYCYVNKERIIKPLASCEIGKTFELRVYTGDGIYSMGVWDASTTRYIGYVTAPYTHKKKLQYLLLPFFGGNRKAPHSMKIKLSKQ